MYEKIVSIHATLAGGDQGQSFSFVVSLVFLSTPPSRVATKDYIAAIYCPAVSIHATLAGGDIFQLDAGGVGNQSFYPRHPRGWRPALMIGAGRRLAFLSTPPSRVATVLHNFGGVAECVSIHATLAGGDDTNVIWFDGSDVSIHATLAGGDQSASIFLLFWLCFYPRHPRGWRPATPLRHWKTTTSFYPRHPRGWRPAWPCRDTGPEGVSIHATLAGGDKAVSPNSVPMVSFLSTPPSRVATARQYQSLPRSQVFLSTPPSRVATAGATMYATRQKMFLSTPPSRVATYALRKP